MAGKRKRYQILDAGRWRTVFTARRCAYGWLDYSIREDGGVTIGLARPGTWREKEDAKKGRHEQPA